MKLKEKKLLKKRKKEVLVIMGVEASEIEGGIEKEKDLLNILFKIKGWDRGIVNSREPHIIFF